MLTFFLTAVTLQLHTINVIPEDSEKTTFVPICHHFFSHIKMRWNYVDIVNIQSVTLVVQRVCVKEVSPGNFCNSWIGCGAKWQKLALTVTLGRTETTASH